MKYKPSHYILITDTVDKNNTSKILYATRTASSIVLSKEIISKFESSNFEEIPSEILSILISIEAVVPLEENELYELTEKSKILSSNTSQLNFTIQLTANCQLGCDYCGQKHEKQNMSSDLIENILNRFNLLLQKKQYKEVDVAWFGGEPLMSWSLMRNLAPRLREIANNNSTKYMSHLVSNGLSLKSDIYKELATNMDCTFIEITLDGTKEYHDSRRNTKSKEDTFDIIFNNLLSIVSLDNYPINNCYISVRCNVDDRNKESVVPLLELLAEHNLQNKIRFYVAPVYHWGNNAHLLTSKEEFSINEIDWFIKMYQLGFDFPIVPDDTNPIVCSAVTPDYELINPWGDVYNCTETPLVPFYGKEYIIGNISKDITNVIPFEQRPYVDWYDKIRDSNNNIFCTSCKILPICGGRCPKSWQDGVPPCPSMKFNMEDRLVLSYIYAKTEINKITND